MSVYGHGGVWMAVVAWGDMGGHGKGAQRGTNWRGGVYTGPCMRRANNVRTRTRVTRRGRGEVRRGIRGTEGCGEG